MRILPLILFGLAFGFVEAAIVVYLRAIYEPMRAAFYPNVPPADLFPLITLQQLAQTGKMYLLHIEIARELATIVMLGAVALAVSRKPAEWLAAFVVAFGVWDIAFYAFLELTIGWPASLLTWDVLFLIPVPWYGPVIAPMMVAAAMIASGTYYLRRPFPIGGKHWIAIFAGALVLTIAFCSDWRNLMAGGLPNPFPWIVFAAGLVLGVGGFLAAARR